MIAVFAYAFPHRKTHDFLLELALAGHRDVTVIAAPFRTLPDRDKNGYFRIAAQCARPLDTALICNRLGYRFVETSHDDVLRISELVKENQLRLGIVSGARILKRVIIELFADGIVNFHPGKIPETSGLDAFFHTLKNGVDAGVTTHFIDSRVDAGDFLAFDAVTVHADDSPEDVQFNTYALQLHAFRKFLDNQSQGRLVPLPIGPISKKNIMQVAEKLGLLQQFPVWRASRFYSQTGDRLISHCETGQIDSAMQLLQQFPGLQGFRTENGWTPLIVACFNEHTELAAALLKAGADPNATGHKGTSVLMYAKTPLMSYEAPDTSLLDLLIEAGADVSKRDSHGRAVQHYVSDHHALAEYFSKKS